jgi:chromosomal replication initiation ATPase DnaA
MKFLDGADPMTTARPTRYTALRDLIADVAAYYELPVERMTNMEWRDRRTVEARKVAAWLLCERFPNERVSTISHLLGYRERSGASHAVADLERTIHLRPALREHLDILRAAA